VRIAVFLLGRVGGCRKTSRKKHEVVEAPDASGKISRKQFEEELAKLQVELTRLQTWVKHLRDGRPIRSMRLKPLQYGHLS
jgi:hypothetical protein